MLPPLASALLFACAPGGVSARAAFVQDVLVEDNRIWLTRDPALVARKFETMAADPYDFMRGTVALHFADLARPEPGRTPTRFLRSTAATAILLVGDPHPENATLCHPEPGHAGDPTLEFVDLDAAGFGPWTLDLRRAALGIEVLGRGLDGCGPGCREAAQAALTLGYVDGLMAPSAPPGRGRIVDALVARAQRRGGDGARLDALTLRSADGGRHFVHTASSRLEPLSRAEDAVVQAAFGDWLGSGAAPSGVRVLDTARRFGSGVSSQPALRFAVLWDTGLPGPTDDHLLQIREVVDAPVPPGRALPRTASFEDNAARVEFAAATLWSRPDADPWAAGLHGEGLALKSLSWMDWLQPINHDHIGEAWEAGDLETGDIAGLASTLGHLLAASHSRGDTATGEPAGPVIRRDLERGGGAPALLAEVRSLAPHDADRLARDHRIFRSLLETEGPLLGAEALVDGLR